ncbi:hypothetical protein ACHAWF_017683, partial [Thalassiosira exigua]
AISSSTGQLNHTRQFTMGAVTAMSTFAAVFGNVLEWYDFALYGFFSDVLAQVFFPPLTPGEGEHRNLILSYVVFGAAFVCRPIGGAITGHVGDKYGRKRALVLSYVVMSIPTVAMAFLPTYAQVGGLSTALLVICRVLQGFSVGGQLPSTMSYTLETKPKEEWGYYGGLISLAGNGGVILGNLVGALVRQVLTTEQLVSWGWRAAFFSGVTIIPVTLFVQCYAEEHHPNAGEYDDNQEGEVGADGTSSTTSEPKHPMMEALKRENWPALISAILCAMLFGGAYYLTAVWMAIFMDILIQPSVPGAFWVNLVTNTLGMALAQLFTGWLSDRFNRAKMMLFGAISLGIAGPFMVWIISGGTTVGAFFSQLCIGILFSFYGGPFTAWLIESFPPKIRLSAIGLGYNMAMCLVSGFTPAVATAMVQGIGPVAPGFLYTLLSGLALIGMFISIKMNRHIVSTPDDDYLSKESHITDDLSAHLL